MYMHQQYNLFRYGDLSLGLGLRFRSVVQIQGMRPVILLLPEALVFNFSDFGGFD